MKKTIFFITLLLFNVSNLFAQNCSNLNIDPAKQYNSTIDLGYYTFGLKVTVANQGTLASLEALNVAKSDQSQMALFKDNNGEVGDLIVKTEMKSLTSADGSIIKYTPATSNILIQPGNYWVVLELLGEATAYPKKDLNDGSKRFVSSFNEGGTSLYNDFRLFGLNYDDFDVPLGLNFNCSSLSVFENNMNKISLFPNPSSKTIFVKGLKKETNYSIINANGQVVTSGKIDNSNSISIDSLPIGIYYVVLENQTKLKFIKK